RRLLRFPSIRSAIRLRSRPAASSLKAGRRVPIRLSSCWMAGRPSPRSIRRGFISIGLPMWGWSSNCWWKAHSPRSPAAFPRCATRRGPSMAGSWISTCSGGSRLGATPLVRVDMNHDISSLAARGACPTLDHPMPVADGLLARFRPETGLTSKQLAALAEAAELCGNGLIEITARGNIQVRGLSEASASNFRAALGDAAIVAQSAPAIEYSPLAGHDPKATADPRPLARRLRVVCDEALAEGALSPKLSIVLITGGQVLLDGLKADIRLVARNDAWALELGGIALGLLEEGDVPDAVAVILRALQAEGPRARGAELDAGHVAEKLTSLRPLDHVGVRPVG